MNVLSRGMVLLCTAALLPPCPPPEEEGQVRYAILVIGDGMQLAHEIAASRYLHGTDRGLAHHALPVQTLCTTWDVTTYNRYARALGAAPYDPRSFDPRIGYDPARGGDRTYDGAWTPPSEDYFFTPLLSWEAPKGREGTRKKIPATDSASSATALSCGVKTDDGNIAWLPGDPPGGALTTVAERARAQKGAAFGVVTTVPFSHATPAAFVSHNVDRDNTAAIAAEMIRDVRPDVVIGAGHPATTAPFPWRKEEEYTLGTFVKSKEGDFYECTQAGISGKTVPKWDPAPGAATADGTVLWTRRPNGMNFTFIGKEDYEGLSAGTRPPYDEYRFVERAPGRDGAKALASAVEEILSRPGGRRLFGLFGGRRRYMDHPVPVDDPGHPRFLPPPPEDPPLAACASAALRVLTHRAGPKGFFLMVEAGDIDWANHQRDYAWMIGAMRQLDETVRTIIAFVEDPSTPLTWENTLLIVTADHANGGLRFAGDRRLGKGALPRQIEAAAPRKTGEEAPPGPAPTAPPPDPDEERRSWTYPGQEIRYGAPGHHTNEPVTVHARGAGASFLRSYEGRWYPGTRLVDNTHLYEVLRRAMGLAP